MAWCGGFIARPRVKSVASRLIVERSLMAEYGMLWILLSWDGVHAGCKAEGEIGASEMTQPTLFIDRGISA